MSQKKNGLVIRPLRAEERGLLKDFLYEAIFVPPGVQPPARSIVELPELRIYTEDFGSRRGDHCLVADPGEGPVAAVWTRLMRDYGYVDDETPSLSISVLAEWRGQGIGTRLLEAIFALLKKENYKRVSLSVQKENRALRLYLRLGFEVLLDRGGECVMLRAL